MRTKKRIRSSSLRIVGNRWKRWSSTLLGSIALDNALFVSRAVAHGDAHPMILAITRQLESQPTNTALYLQRSDLWQSDGNWTNALKDLDIAAKQNPRFPVLDYGYGRAFLLAGQFPSATNSLTIFLLKNPKHAGAWLARGRAFAELKLGDLCLHDFGRAIENATAPTPDLYLERANLTQRFFPEDWQRAIDGLDQGITEIGPLITLHEAAITLEQKAQRWDAGLQRINQLIELGQRREYWMVRRARLLQLAQRTDAARKAWGEVLAEIERLPERLRARGEIQSVLREAKEAL